MECPILCKSWPKALQTAMTIDITHLTNQVPASRDNRYPQTACGFSHTVRETSQRPDPRPAHPKPCHIFDSVPIFWNLFGILSTGRTTFLHES
jgi:hypothetical protein